MDMLYARYSSPMDLMRTYIQQGRFGDFVSNFIQADNERRKAEAAKEDDLFLWIAYVHRERDLEMSFKDWKAKILGGAAAPKKAAGSDHDLDDKGIQDILKHTFKGW